jgi:hypothetical protein
MGASLVPSSDDDDWEYRRKRARLEEKLQQQQQRHLSTLSIEQWDKAIRRMHSQIGLSKSDRKLLSQSRGMTEEQIDRGLYFSLAPYQDISAAIPLNFPGVHSSGRTLTNKYQGIAIPLFDSEGRAIAIQVRVTEEKVEGGRYRWLRNSHLANGELPLTFIRPDIVRRKQIALVEGTGFKPQIAADKLGQIVIGASGGQHSGSPQQLAKYLEAAVGEGVDTSTLQIYIDGGDVINSHVLNRLSTLVDLLTSWGKQVEIAWWGQETKDDPDIDELDDLDAIAIDPSNPNLSVTQFYEALVEQLGLDVEKSEWKTELVFDGQGKAVLNKDGTQKRKKYKLRRINSDSWKLFELFCEHRRAMKERRENPEETSSDVPATVENLYETEVGWNMGLSQTEQRIEGSFSGRKNEATDDDIQICLKQLRQVKTADDYRRIYERSERLVTEAWKLLNPPEQLRIQQICDEGIDPLSKWLEGERVWLWHPFAENKWGLATVKQVVRGACGFIYVLRDDGFGLHLGREKLHLIEPTNIELV